MGTDDAGLPDSFAEFINGDETATDGLAIPQRYDPDTEHQISPDERETYHDLLDDVEDVLDDASVDANGDAMVSKLFAQAPAIWARKPKHIALEYTAVLAFSKNEEWQNPNGPKEGYEGVRNLIETVADEETPSPRLVVPRDIDKLGGRGTTMADSILSLLRGDLDAVTPDWGDGDRHEKLIAGLNREYDADGDGIAALNRAYVQDIAEGGLNEFSDLPAASPQMIVEGLEMNTGPYQHAPNNRITNLLDLARWRPHMDKRTTEKGGVPRQYQIIDTEDIPPVKDIVLDHATVFDALTYHTRYASEEGNQRCAGEELFALLDDVVTYQQAGHDIDVYLLDDQQAKLSDALITEYLADPITDDFEDISGRLQIDRAHESEAPDGIEEDYAIAQSAYEAFASNGLEDATEASVPVVATPDDHYAELPGVIGMHVAKLRETLHAQYGKPGQ